MRRVAWQHVGNCSGTAGQRVRGGAANTDPEHGEPRLDGEAGAVPSGGPGRISGDGTKVGNGNRPPGRRLDRNFCILHRAAIASIVPQHTQPFAALDKRSFVTVIEKTSYDWRQGAPASCLESPASV